MRRYRMSWPIGNSSLSLISNRWMAKSAVNSETSGLCLTTLQQTRNDDAAGMVPALELACRIGKISAVHKAQQSRAGEAGATEIEDEVNHGVELVLIDLRGHQPVDASHRAGDIASQEGFGQILCDGQASVYARPCVAAADRPHSDLVGIGCQPQSFELPGKVYAIVTIGVVRPHIPLRLLRPECIGLRNRHVA